MTGASGPREENVGQVAGGWGGKCRRGGKGIGKGEGRIGEARNPGPPSGEGEARSGGGMTVEEAWARVQEERDWVPAWKTWSRQVVKPGRQGNRLDFTLVPPLVAEEEEEQAAGGREEWEEEELEAFLQQCELEAGLIQEVDVEEARGRADSWRAWEEGATMAGIACPSVEEQGAHGGRGRDQVAAEEAEEAERVVPPPREQRRAVNRKDDGKRTRQRWRPPCVQVVEGEPRVEEALDPPLEVVQAVDAVPVQARPLRNGVVRPRGRRQRGGPAELFEVEVVTFNGSGSPQAIAALGVLKEEKRRVAAVLVQEHLARGDAVADLQHAARRFGFKLAPCEAAQGRGGGLPRESASLSRSIADGVESRGRAGTSRQVRRRAAWWELGSRLAPEAGCSASPSTSGQARG